MIHKAFLGCATTQLKIATDPTFLPSLGKPVNGIPTGCVIYAGGERGLSQGQAVEPLQQYKAKISLYGKRGASTRVTEVKIGLTALVGVGWSRDMKGKRERSTVDFVRVLDLISC